MLKKSTLWHYLLVILWLAGVTFAWPNAAAAQDETTLAVLPANPIVALLEGETVTVELWVTRAVDLNAFVVTVTYDSGLAVLESWEYGDFLTSLYLMALVNEPGTVRVAVAQMGQPAVSGDGSLLRLTFSGVAEGDTPLTITEAVFSNQAGVKAYPDLLHGSLNVFLPRFTLDGTVSLQGMNGAGGVPVTLGVGEVYQYGPYTVLTTDVSGQNLHFTAVAADTYQITTHQARFLNIHEGMQVFVTVGGDRFLPELQLKGGNAVWTDNVIDVSDASVVGAWYKRSLDEFDDSQPYHPDVNFDGVVNIQDLALVAGNFDLTSESAYEAWQP